MRVLNAPPMRDSSSPGRRGWGNEGTFCCCPGSLAFFFGSSAVPDIIFFLIFGGFGNTTVMAVSSGTHPGH